MNDRFKFQLRMEKLLEAEKRAREDPRVKEIQEKIEELQKQREELVEKISDDIYKEMIGS